MSGRLQGKKALITGGAGGLGQAMAEMFVAEGARVTVSDLNAEAVAAVAARLSQQHGAPVLGIAHDVTKADQWQATIAAAVDAMDGLSVLVHNAGVCVPASVEDAALDDWHKTMAVNTDSVFLGTKFALPLLRASQPASIINVASISALIAGHNLAAYNASKAAVWMLTKSIALHAARGGDDIRCNSIHPTFIETAMVADLLGADGAGISDERRRKLERQIPLGRLGQPADVAHAAIYLASDESRFMTGAEIKLDGGISAA